MATSFAAALVLMTVGSSIIFACAIYAMRKVENPPDYDKPFPGTANPALVQVIKRVFLVQNVGGLIFVAGAVIGIASTIPG